MHSMTGKFLYKYKYVLNLHMDMIISVSLVFQVTKRRVELERNG